MHVHTLVSAHGVIIVLVSVPLYVYVCAGVCVVCVNHSVSVALYYQRCLCGGMAEGV